MRAGKHRPPANGVCVVRAVQSRPDLIRSEIGKNQPHTEAARVVVSV